MSNFTIAGVKDVALAWFFTPRGTLPPKLSSSGLRVEVAKRIIKEMTV